MRIDEHWASIDVRTEKCNWFILRHSSSSSNDVIGVFQAHGSDVDDRTRGLLQLALGTEWTSVCFFFGKYSWLCVSIFFSSWRVSEIFQKTGWQFWYLCRACRWCLFMFHANVRSTDRVQKRFERRLTVSMFGKIVYCSSFLTTDFFDVTSFICEQNLFCVIVELQHFDFFFWKPWT